MNLAGIETNGSFNNDMEVEYVHCHYYLWDVYEMSDYVMLQAEEQILANFLDKYRKDIPEEMANSIENYHESYWLDDISCLIDFDIYKEMYNCLEDLKTKICDDFSDFQDKFKNAYYEVMDEIEAEKIKENNERIIAEYGCPDWAKEFKGGYVMFVNMFAGDNYAMPEPIFDAVRDAIDYFDGENIEVLHKNKKGQYFIKTTRDRIICLEEYV